MTIAYGITTVTAPAHDAVDSADVAAFCRIDEVADADEITRLIGMATDEAMRITGRAFVTGTYKYVAESWPLSYSGSYLSNLTIPRSPLLTVSSVQYYDENNALQTLSSSKYDAITAMEPGGINLHENESWPTIYPRPDAVQITFTAGYGSSTASTPKTVQQAIMLLCRHFNSYGNPNTHNDNVGDYETARRLLVGLRVGGWSY